MATLIWPHYGGFQSQYGKVYRLNIQQKLWLDGFSATVNAANQYVKDQQGEFLSAFFEAAGGTYFIVPSVA